MSLYELSAAAFIGSMLMSLYGWLGQGGPFDWRKMSQSAIAGAVASMVFALGYQAADKITARDILLAITSGWGFDNLFNRTAALGQAKQPPTPITPPGGVP